jgi:hypothetical protein
MADKRERNPWNDRYGDDENDKSESEEPSKRSKTAENSMISSTSETEEAAESGSTVESAEREESSEETSVRERKNVNMYLPEGLVDELQLRYSELNVEWRRQHGEDMPKNDQFYPAVVRSALEDTTIEEELGLE